MKLKQKLHFILYQIKFSYTYTYRYCRTSFQYISLGISPLSLFCARSLGKRVEYKNWRCEFDWKSKIEVKILQNFQVRNLRQSGWNWPSQLIVFQNPEKNAVAN